MRQGNVQLLDPDFFWIIPWKQCSKSNILTLDYKLVLENSSSVAVDTLLNTIIYLKTVKYLNIRLRQIY